MVCVGADFRLPPGYGARIGTLGGVDRRYSGFPLR